MSLQEQNLIDSLKDLLLGREAHTQEEICTALEKLGFEINQSKVSRLLRKIGAIKITNIHNQVVYSLPREPPPPTPHTPLKDLIVNISHNEALIVISTSPGSASLVARVLDYFQISCEILGTLAGDDTIFVAPKSLKDIPLLYKKIKALLTKE